MVGPTKRKPRRLSSFAIAFDSGVDGGHVGRRPRRRAVGRARTTTAARSATRRPPAARARRGRWRSPPRSWPGCARSRRRPSAAPRRRRRTPATASGSKPAKAARKLSRLRRIVSHDEPGLERLQAQPLVQRRVVAHRPAPLLVVVGDVVGRRHAPRSSAAGRRGPDEAVAHGAGPYRLPITRAMRPRCVALRSRRSLIAPRAPPARGRPALPPARQGLHRRHGRQLGRPRSQRQTGNHPAVFGFFTKFGRRQRVHLPRRRAGGRAADAAHLHAGRLRHPRGRHAAAGSPAARATRYLVRLNRRIAEYGEPTYIRLMAEMNQANNGYSRVRPQRPLARRRRTRPPRSSRPGGARR